VKTQSLAAGQRLWQGPALSWLRPGLARGVRLISRLTLAQRFMIICLIILVAGALVLGQFVVGEIRAKVIDSTSATTAMYVDSFISEHLQELGDGPTLSAEHVAVLDNLTASSPFQDRIAAVKVWTLDGTVVYSTSRELVGRRFEVASSLERAQAGTITTELSSLGDDENIAERRSFDRLLETYAPVHEHDTGRVIGVVEFYQDPSGLLDEISDAQRRAWMIVGVATFAMYLSLSTLVAGASRTITRQNRRLEETVSDLTSLQNVTDSALLSLSLDAFLNALLERAVEATRSDAGAVVLAEGDLRLTVREARAIGSAGRSLDDQGASPFLWSVLTERRAAQWHAETDGPDPYLSALDLCCVLAVPLVARDDAVGVAFVGATADRAYTQEEQRLLEVLSERVALFIQNAALQERVLRAASEKTETDERLVSRIAHDLHDGPAQNMAVSLLRLDAVKEAVARGDWSPASQNDLDLIRVALEASLKELRELSAGLNLPELAKMSLSDSIWEAVRQHERLTSSRVAVDSTAPPDGVPLPVKIAVFRVLQEALNNAYRHGGTKEQNVFLRTRGRSLLIEVSDRGIGFDVDAVRGARGGGLGLPGMRERIELLGGTLTIISSAGQGTRVVASVPLGTGA